MTKHLLLEAPSMFHLRPLPPFEAPFPTGKQPSSRKCDAQVSPQPMPHPPSSFPLYFHNAPPQNTRYFFSFSSLLLHLHSQPASPSVSNYERRDFSTLTRHVSVPGLWIEGRDSPAAPPRAHVPSAVVSAFGRFPYRLNSPFHEAPFSPPLSHINH